jgi:hypothetical protein
MFGGVYLDWRQPATQKLADTPVLIFSLHKNAGAS